MAELFINTAASETFFAITRDGKTTDYQWTCENNEASILLPKIQQALKGQGIKPSDLQKVTAVKGPGSFTGLRIGITIANTLTHTLGIDLFEVDLFTLYEHRHQERPGTIIIKAGKSEVYIKPADAPLQDLKMVKFEESIIDQLADNIWGDLMPQQEEQLKKWLQESPQKTWIPDHHLIPTKEILKTLPTKKAPLIQPLYIKTPKITPSKKLTPKAKT